MSGVKKDVLSHEYGRVIDNRRITMKDALNDLLPKSENLDMAVAYFYLSGLQLVERPVHDLLEQGGTVRILMGNRTNYATAEMLSNGFSLRTAKDCLFDEIKGIVSYDDRRTELAYQFSKWIAEGKVDVRIYVGEANYFHAKSYLMYRTRERADDGFAIVGSSNFSESGLLGNTELNTVSQDNFGALTRWFNEVWESEEVIDFSRELLEVIDHHVPKPRPKRYAYPHPKETYLTFARYFAQRIIEPIDGSFMKTLYHHQVVGVSEMKLRLDQFGTGILCDGVGLGKTRTAAATLMASESNSALILASTKLHDQWREELDIVGVPRSRYQLMSKEEMQRKTLSELHDYLHFDLIVVDEAHQGLKNDRTKLYRNLTYIKAQSHKNVRGLLLTATPWNNARSDVFNIGRLFLDKKSVPPQKPYSKYLRFNSRKASKAIEMDDRAFEAFWRDLFLQRTRKTLGRKDVEFARRSFPVVEVMYEPIKEKAFAANYIRIGDLRLPYINPIRYADHQEDDYDFSTDRLKLLFLKRADSSWPAFKHTLLSIMEKLRIFQEDLVRIQGGNSKKEDFALWLRQQYGLTEEIAPPKDIGIGMEESKEILEHEFISWQNQQRYRKRVEKQIASLEESDTIRILDWMLKHARQDLVLLNEILRDLDEAFARKDEKYEALRKAVKECLGAGEKVLLITQFRDTAVAFFDRLIEDEEFSAYRMGLVTGQRQDWKIGKENQDTREHILERFSPISKGNPEFLGSSEELDLVIGTEALAIGQNLQDARVLMNIDLPFNPMNLEQRIGRIDRPRSDGQVPEVDIYTFPSMPVIESELKMMERLKRKLEGIYQDTFFDDLVLPHYQEFLRGVLRNRKAKSADIEKMIENTVVDSIVRVGADEHSIDYREAQKRMRKAIEEASLIKSPVQPYVIDNVSLSKSGGITVVVQIILRDVNGRDIDQYLKPVLIGDKIVTELSVVEAAWDEATWDPVRDDKICPLHIVKREQEAVMHRLSEELLSEEVLVYNQGTASAAQLEGMLIDSKVQKVICDIQNAIQGINRDLIARRIQEAGYGPSSVRQLLCNLQAVDIRYDFEEARAVDELYRNLERLWDNYGDYYEQFASSAEASGGEEIRQSARKASKETSSIHWEIGNLCC
ncbi:MAG: phospholipase D-like domain-containing protein [Limnochordia bacterium]|nr:phospholipase D-like domain-containing protein [Limnochordia bacterium]MDD4517100.1 phospholipase D-like domain-containing protein [Limnochordia bacterium]